MTYFSGGTSAIKKYIRQVEIPDNITEIKDRSFEDYKTIEHILLSENIHFIGKYAFANCFSLKEIIIPPYVSKIDDCAFKDCGSLDTVKIPNSLKILGNNVFSGCVSLKEFNVPQNIQKIGEYILPFPFLGFDINLTRVNVYNYIGLYNRRIVFGEKYLCSVVIPYSVRFVNGNRIPLHNFHEKTKVRIPQGIKVISKYVFSYVPSVTAISIPNSVFKIGKYAFSNCTGLKYINIPNSVIKIGKYAFLNCCSLENIKIPYSVEKIGDYAFMDCDLLINGLILTSSTTKIGKDILFLSKKPWNNHVIYDN